MKIRNLIQELEQWCPPSLQESYDNCGLMVGDPNQEIKGVLVCLDITEAVLLEAKAKNCNVIISHHPLIFSGLKSLTGKNLVERCVMQAIKMDIALYAMHTNLDNVQFGVNVKIAEKLGLKNARILLPKQGLLNKLVVFVPKDHIAAVSDAVFAAGAGQIGNYDECSFRAEGTGTFKPNDKANPFAGEIGKREQAEEFKLEVLVPNHALSSVLSAMKAAHPYEEVAYDVIALKNKHQDLGAGMIAELEQEESEQDFLKRVKENLSAAYIRHTDLLNKKVKKIAFCGGSGSFLLPSAIAAGADVFVSADFTYHKFFDADGKILIADVGHFEIEQFTGEIIAEFVAQKFSTFAACLADKQKNPVNYFI